MPPAARVKDPTGHPGVIGATSRADRPDRWDAGSNCRDASACWRHAASTEPIVKAA